MISTEKLELVGGTAAAKTLLDVVLPDAFPHLHRDHTIAQALDRMAAARLDVLPVVSRANIHELEGIVTLQDVLQRYGISPTE